MVYELYLNEAVITKKKFFRKENKDMDNQRERIRKLENPSRNSNIQIIRSILQDPDPTALLLSHPTTAVLYPSSFPHSS